MTGVLADAIRRSLAAAAAERSAPDADALRAAQLTLRSSAEALAAAQQQHDDAAAAARTAQQRWARRWGGPPDLTTGTAAAASRAAAAAAAAAAVQDDAGLVAAAARLAGAEVDALTAWRAAQSREASYRRQRRRVVRRWGLRGAAAAGLPPAGSRTAAPPRPLIAPLVTLTAAQFAQAAAVPQAAAMRLLRSGGVDGAQRTPAGWRIPLLAVPAARAAAGNRLPGADQHPVQQALADLAAWQASVQHLAEARARLAAAQEEYRGARCTRTARTAAAGMLPPPPRRRPLRTEAA